MSFSALPKELRLKIWTIAYFSQPPRYVTLRTHPHDESHPETIFCPRYSPSLPPTVVNICRESRAEARYQASKAGHLVRLPSPLPPGDSDEFFFRFDVDVLLYDLCGSVRHFDDSPENGFLMHFRAAQGCDVSALRRLAVTKVHAARTDGTVSNCISEFPNLDVLIFVADEADVADDELKEAFVRTAVGIFGMYEFDRCRLYEGPMQLYDFLTNYEVAVRGPEGELRMLSREELRGWTEVEPDWHRALWPQDHSSFYWQASADSEEE